MSESVVSPDSHPLTAAQLSIWLASRIFGQSFRFNAGFYFRLPPSASLDVAVETLAQLADEATLQRVRIREGDEIARQEIAFSAEDVTASVSFPNEADMLSWMSDEFRNSMRIDGSSPLFHQWVIEVGRSIFIFVKYHHIVLDGFGQKLLCARFETIYKSRVSGSERGSPEWTSDVDYFAAVGKRASSATRLARIAECASPFEDVADPSTLGWTRSLFAADVLQSRSTLSEATRSALRGKAEHLKASESTILVALIAAYLHRVTGDSRIVFGLTLAARTRQAMLRKPSMQVNELPIGFDFSKLRGFDDLVRAARGEIERTLSFQEIRGEEVQRHLGRAGHERRLTRVLVNVISFGAEMVIEGETVPVHQIATGPVADLTIDLFVSRPEISVIWDANPANYTRDELDDHASRFNDNADVCLGSGGLGAPDDVFYSQTDLRAMRCLVGPSVRWARDERLFQAIDRHAASRPASVAVECDDHSWSYAELKRQTDGLARRLSDAGARAGDAIGIYGRRTTLMVGAILAIQKAGCAYVPLDPSLPRARLLDQIEQAGVRSVVRWDDGPDLGVTSVIIDGSPSRGASPGEGLPVPPGDATAYIIFTSGSTGRPKGVMVGHRAIENRIFWMQEEYGLTLDDVVLQKTPFTFDVSVWEFFWPLVVGARLIMAAPDLHMDPRRLHRAARDRRITTIHFVPTMLDAFLDDPAAVEPSCLRRVFCSGEALKPATVRRFFSAFPATALYNLYGPTEAAVDVSHWACSPPDGTAAAVPIGWPVANTELRVLNAARRPSVVGAPGELYIGGVQVASGYVNRPDLTAERFVELPGAEGRFYRTGDLVVLTADRGVNFLGRLDHQVKIRGLRIELGEIEAQIARCDAVRQCVVVVDGAAEAAARLVAYVVLERRNALDDVRRRLAEALPDYMLPAQWVVLDELPSLSSGKIDRSALPAPSHASAAAGPDTEAERLVASAWAEVLNVREVGVDTPFFELGGDSMMTIRVRAALEEKGWTFDLAELLRNPTARRLASMIKPHEARREHVRERFEGLSAEDKGRLPPSLDDAFPMSAMQEAMVYQAEVDGDSSVYRVVTSLAVERPLRWGELSEAVRLTILRHPLLRSAFDLATFSRPLILVEKTVPTPLTELDDLSALSETDRRQAVAAWIERAKFTGFDLSRAPGLRFYAHRTGPGRFQLSVVEHHAVLDGWSDVLMLDEVVRAYDALLRGDPPTGRPLRSHFADFVAAEASCIANAASKDYWRSLNGAVDASPLPKTPVKGATRHRSHGAPLPPGLQAALVRRATQCRRSLKSLLFAAHLKVLSVVTGSQAVATGMVFNGRLDQPDGDAVVGVFLNTLPFSTSIEGKSFLALAEELGAFEERSHPHGRYPFPLMQRDADGALQLDSYVNFMDFHRDWGDGAVVSDARGVADTNFPLAVNFLIDPVTQALSLWLDCDEGSLDPDVCARMPGYYVTALHQVADGPERLVTEASLVGREELETIAAFNATAVAYDADLPVHQSVARQARLRPDGIALVHLGREVTYRDLAALSDGLASALAAARVRRGDIVGVCVPRGPELVAGLLAVHRVGAAFLPLDPTYPVERLNDIVADSELRVVLSWPTSPKLGAEVAIDASAGLTPAPDLAPNPETAPHAPAYVIYTSGSTGRPKGAVVSHRNLLNCFAGMDRAVGCGPDDCMLALTSVSFDISILELLWPLTKGAKVVIGGERQIEHLSRDPLATQHPLDVSLFFFGAASRDETRADAYRLVLDAARFADRHRFKAVWTPERHFHEFGGLYPNPSVLSAALATITEHVELRAGSVVAPLHDSVRLAEEWSLVDNLSNGRVGIALASGWNSADFALAPSRYQGRKDSTMEALGDLRALWGGGTVTRTNGVGKAVELSIHPQPVRPALPIWLTSAGSPTTFAAAGAAGLNLLTHLLGQTVEQLAAKVASYRAAWRAAGHAGSGCVTLMVHTFLLPDEAQARSLARHPFRNYLRSSTGLLRELAASMGVPLAEALEGDDMEAVLDLAVDRYFDEAGLFGSPDSVAPMLGKLQAAGADELACLIDFGISNTDTVRGLSSLDRLRASLERACDEARHSCEALIERHGVTMMQSTPSFMTAAMADPALVPHLARLRAVLVGGEPLPSGLASQMREDLGARVFNMYGPTETTIWSSAHELTSGSVGDLRVPIGRPLANTRMQVLDVAGHPAPIGVPGELWIGGDGVCQGYWNRADLTEARFRRLGDGGVHYRTGDRVSWRGDGELLFFGRVDRQVKLRGHRIELDEVESVLSRHSEVGNVAVVLDQAAAGASELVAFLERGARSPALRNLSSALVEDWGSVWDQTYRGRDAGSEGAGSRADFSGWLSSYTGEPIPADEMQEWLASTLAQIDALRPRAIVDVGVGLGIMMRELVSRCAVYTGIDPSEEALRTCAASVAPEAAARCRISLVRDDATGLARVPAGAYDLVLINSVLQYFPDEAYLAEVLREAVRVAGDGGSVFLGDLRSLEDLTAFHTSVQFAKAGAATPLREMRALVERQVRAEREMCLSPAYFAALRGRIPGMGAAELRLKRGDADNELNTFRYDAVIGGRRTPEPSVTLDWHGREVTCETLDAVVARVVGAGAARLRVEGLPNHRLDGARALERLFAEADGRSTKWDIEKFLWERGPSEALSPEAVAARLAASGFEARLLVSPGHGLGRYDLDLTRRPPSPPAHPTQAARLRRATKVDA